MRRMRRDALRIPCILAVTTVLGLLSNALAQRPLLLLGRGASEQLGPQAERISIDSLAAELRGKRSLILVDVRAASAWKQGHPAGALHLPLKRLHQDYTARGLASLLRAAELIVVICDSARCGYADRAAALLQQYGHTGVRVLEGGWKSYVDRNLPVQKP